MYRVVRSRVFRIGYLEYIFELGGRFFRYCSPLPTINNNIYFQSYKKIMNTMKIYICKYQRFIHASPSGPTHIWYTSTYLKLLVWTDNWLKPEDHERSPFVFFFVWLKIDLGPTYYQFFTIVN